MENLRKRQLLKQSQLRSNEQTIRKLVIHKSSRFWLRKLRKWTYQRRKSLPCDSFVTHFEVFELIRILQ